MHPTVATLAANHARATPRPQKSGSNAEYGTVVTKRRIPECPELLHHSAPHMSQPVEGLDAVAW